LRPQRIARGERIAPGMVLAQEVRSANGRVVLDKGRKLSERDLAVLADLPWTELHVLETDAGDLHEDEGGQRLALAVAGEGVQVGELTGGAWPLLARHRGLFELDEERLAQVNAISDLVVYTLPHQYIVLEGELLGRAKIIPFLTRREHVESAEALSAESRGLLRVRRFAPSRVAVLAQETLDARSLDRARRAFEEKLAFFGSELMAVQVVPSAPEQVASALAASVGAGAQLVVVAGSKPMDPLDASLRALESAGARMEKLGVPSHPGTLLWLAYLDGVPVVGAPSCGLFSKATALDLLLPRLLAGQLLSARDLAALGSGGLLTREMAYRFPPYRPTGNRGELIAE
jgi:molybdopterin biosynthesis enzyme